MQALRHAAVQTMTITAEFKALQLVAVSSNGGNAWRWESTHIRKIHYL
jgi:hypothetical protein